MFRQDTVSSQIFELSDSDDRFRLGCRISTWQGVGGGLDRSLRLSPSRKEFDSWEESPK